MVPERYGVLRAIRSDPLLGVSRPPAADRGADACYPRQDGGVGASRKRQHDRGVDPRLEAGDARKRQPYLYDRSAGTIPQGDTFLLQRELSADARRAIRWRGLAVRLGHPSPGLLFGKGKSRAKIEETGFGKELENDYEQAFRPC